MGVAVACNIRKTFPKLRTINVRPRYNWPPEDVLNLVLVSPNLQAVNGLCCLDDIERANLNRLEIFTGLYILPYESLGPVLKKLVRSHSRLVELEICDSELGAVPQSWTVPLRNLLTHSATTLSRFSICGITLMKLLRKIFVLNALEYLEIFLPEALTAQEFTNIAASLRLHISCPQLYSLHLNFEQDECLHRIPSSLSIQNLECFPVCCVHHAIVRKANCFIAAMEHCIFSFPRLSSLTLDLIDCSELCERNSCSAHHYELYKVWTEIPTLESLKICAVDHERCPLDFSLDALFCGISTSETRAIRKACVSSQIDLKNLQLCPVRPSLLHAESKCFVVAQLF